jgi:3-hydroxyacyl-[acyl-carrier-protein] dehydratase
MRYDFEEIERTDSEIRYRLDVPETSRFFAGHFPGNPILPGVAQVQICIEVLANSLDRPVRLARLESVRYRKPVTPGMPCELTIHLEDEDGRVEFRYDGPDGLIADGRMLLANETEARTDA